ncbi:hypothetical protein LguiB_017832 [Lonicera macranthoides]
MAPEQLSHHLPHPRADHRPRPQQGHPYLPRDPRPQNPECCPSDQGQVASDPESPWLNGSVPVCNGDHLPMPDTSHRRPIPESLSAPSSGNGQQKQRSLPPRRTPGSRVRRPKPAPSPDRSRPSASSGQEGTMEHEATGTACADE